MATTSRSNSFNAFTRAFGEAKRIAHRVPHHAPVTKIHDLKVRSMIILAHAAIEQYLEEVTTELATASVDLFKNGGKINVPLFALLTHHRSNICDLAPYPRAATLDLREAVGLAADDALSKHLAMVEENHGIKIKNHNKLLHPVGIDLKLVDSTLPPLLDSFGVKRGNVAHKMRIQTVHTRGDIETDMNNIYRSLTDLDAAVLIAQRAIVHGA